MRRPIRVLHIIRNLGLGGAETNLLNLAGSFDPDRVETHVAYSHGGEFEARFRATGMRLFKYAHGDHRVKSLHTPLIVMRLVGYVRRHRIDVVHTHNFSGHVWGLLAAKLGGAQLVEHVHDFRYTPIDELERRHGLVDQYRYIRYFRHRSDRVVVLTREHAEFVVVNDIATADRVVEQPNGISLDPAAVSLLTERDGDHGIRARCGVPGGAVMILTTARMDESKNIECVLEAAAIVLAAEPAVHFVVAGAGPRLAHYRSRAKALGLVGHVHFAGFVEDIESTLKESDIFLLPSFLELHSIAILEATKMAVPIVVSRGVGCNDAFVDDGVDGMLCDPFEVRPWADALLRLVRDAELRRAMGLRGRQTCRDRFDIRRTAARFESLYRDLAPRARDADGGVP